MIVRPCTGPDCEVCYPEKALDTQVGGDHYSKLNIQPVDYILENDLGYLEGNAIKYLTRHRDKNGAQDIEKAIHYCRMILEKVYGAS